MHLTPREQERLLLAAAADLARRRLARGARIGATEVVERACTVVPAGALLPGVGALVPVLEVEALFPWGSTLVHVDAPFGDAVPVDAQPGEMRAAVGEIA